MEYTLHKLPEGFIITSDELPKDFYNCLMLCTITNKLVNSIGASYIGFYKKVIAQQNQIDFSALTEEEQKEIGWFDVEKLAHNDAVELWMPEDHNYYTGHVLGYKQGFQKAQELLSDRMFTLEEFHKFLDLHTDSAPIEYLKREAIKFLSQPKSWKVELEMDFVHTDHVEGGFEYFPKLINGKVKILKLLSK